MIGNLIAGLMGKFTKNTSPVSFNENITGDVVKILAPFMKDATVGDLRRRLLKKKLRVLAKISENDKSTVKSLVRAMLYHLFTDIVNSGEVGDLLRDRYDDKVCDIVLPKVTGDLVVGDVYDLMVEAILEVLL